MFQISTASSSFQPFEPNAILFALLAIYPTTHNYLEIIHLLML